MTNAISKPEAPTELIPTYIFSSYHRFAQYFEKALELWEHFRQDKTTSDHGYTWWFDGSFYVVEMYYVRGTQGGGTTLVGEEIFRTRKQLDAMTGVMMFSKMFNSGRAARENYNPWGTSKKGGWSLAQMNAGAPRDIGPSTSTALVSQQEIENAQYKLERTKNVFGKPILTDNMTLPELKVAIQQYTGGNLNMDFSTKYRIMGQYSNWLVDLEKANNIAFDDKDKHLKDLRDEIDSTPIEKFLAQILFGCEGYYGAACKEMTDGKSSVGADNPVIVKSNN